MKVQLKRVLKENLARSKEAIPDWVDEVLKVYNSNFEQVGLALSNRLTFAENFNCTEVVREITHAVETEINPLAGKAGNLRVIGVVLVSSEGLVVDGFGWASKSNGNILVTVSFDGGTSATVADCRFEILLG